MGMERARAHLMLRRRMECLRSCEPETFKILRISIIGSCLPRISAEDDIEESDGDGEGKGASGAAEEDGDADEGVEANGGRSRKKARAAGPVVRQKGKRIEYVIDGEQHVVGSTPPAVVKVCSSEKRVCAQYQCTWLGWLAEI